MNGSTHAVVRCKSYQTCSGIFPAVASAATRQNGCISWRNECSSDKSHLASRRPPNLPSFKPPPPARRAAHRAPALLSARGRGRAVDDLGRGRRHVQLGPFQAGAPAPQLQRRRVSTNEPPHPRPCPPTLRGAINLRRTCWLTCVKGPRPLEQQQQLRVQPPPQAPSRAWPSLPRAPPPRPPPPPPPRPRMGPHVAPWPMAPVPFAAPPPSSGGANHPPPTTHVQQRPAWGAGHCGPRRGRAALPGARHRRDRAGAGLLYITAVSIYIYRRGIYISISPRYRRGI
jgi:hypothetical protein